MGLSSCSCQLWTPHRQAWSIFGMAWHSSGIASRPPVGVDASTSTARAAAAVPRAMGSEGSQAAAGVVVS